MELGSRPQRRDQLQRIAETALELFGADFTSGIRAGRTTADVVCEWLRVLAAIRKAVEPMMLGGRVQAELFGEHGDGI